MTELLADVLSRSSIVVTCGPGGVGKTTTAAALGIVAANRGRRVLVVTVDPARRLADALGLDVEAKMYEPHRVSGVGKKRGSLSALMLDAEATFDRMIVDRADDPKKAERILTNRVYRSIAGSLSGAQDYMAIERLHQLNASGAYDLIIVDTPPSRDAIDLLEAPERLVRFLSHPIYRALTISQRSFARVTNAGTSAFLWIVRKLAGPQLVEDTVEFFRSLAGIEQGMRQRASEMATLLRADDTSFVMVSSPRAEAVTESAHLASAVIEGGFHLCGVVVNMLHPLPAELTGLDDLSAGPLADHVAFHNDLRALALSEREEMQRLIELAVNVAVVEVPLLETDVHDVDSLTQLADLIVPDRREL
jgi:anion-transporting  ArsA/GET3 family ATPase